MIIPNKFYTIKAIFFFHFFNFFYVGNSLVDCWEEQKLKHLYFFETKIDDILNVEESTKYSYNKLCKMSLFEAVSANNYELVKTMIDEGADVNVKISKGRATPLIIATRQGHKEICSLLIEKGTDMYSKNSALYNAVGNGHKEICEILIANGADVNNVEFNMFIGVSMII